MIHSLHKNQIIEIFAYDVKFVKQGRLFNIPIATVDHVIDREFDGPDSERNIVLSCSECNNKKASWKNVLPETEYLEKVKNEILDTLRR